MQNQPDPEAIARSVVARRTGFLQKNSGSLERHRRDFQSILKKCRKWHDERVSALCEDEADRILSELSWLSTLNHSAPGYFGGLIALSRAFKRVRVGGISFASPWPTRRNYYLHADLVAAQPAIMNWVDEVNDISMSALEDFRPIDEPAPLLPEPDTRDEKVRISLAGQAVPSPAETGNYKQPRYRFVGTRLFIGQDSGRYMLLLRPADEALEQLHALMARLGMPVHDTSKLALVVQGYTVEGKTVLGFAAWEIGRPEETAIGSSPLKGDSMIWEDPEYDLIAAYQGTLLEDIGQTLVRASLLPTYFDFQVEQISTDEPSARTLEIPSDQTRKPAARRAYKLIRAIRKVRPDDWLSTRPTEKGATTRREPETQVPVTGFWRRLDPTSIGKRPDGSPAMGRTWVSAHTRWQDKPEAESRPRMKEPLKPYLKP